MRRLHAQVWTGPLAGANPVSLLRWGTAATARACALLVRDLRSGQEVERPYHPGMEQELPERFKVKFTARMFPSEDPVASVPPGRSFLFLHRFTATGVMPLLGVVEEAQLVHTSADPWTTPHVYHLHVRRLQANQGYGGSLSGPGAVLRNTLVHHFGVSVVQALGTPVMLHGSQLLDVLHLPAGTPRIPA